MRRSRKNEASWLEVSELEMFKEGDNPRSGTAWKHLECLWRGGKLRQTDILTLESLLTEAMLYGQHFADASR